MKLKILIVLICLIVPALLWIADIVNDRRYRVIIKNTTYLYKTPEAAAYSGVAFETLKRGEKLKVKRVTYGKDFMALEVEKENGIEGWVINDNNIKVIKPK